AALLVGARRLPIPAWGPLALVVVAGLALAAAAPGYVLRHARAFGSPSYSALLGALAVQPGYDRGERPVAMTPVAFPLAGGDRLRHAVSLVPGSAPCDDVRGRAQRGWLIIVRFQNPVSRRLAACLGNRAPLGRFGDAAGLGEADLYGPMKQAGLSIDRGGEK
ncbi:MAG: hypothetical protein M3Z33_00525, partial [Actinomycetota bacterium]|nr:hypothetical protein [Actinomycetota bacterium]